MPDLHEEIEITITVTRVVAELLAIVDADDNARLRTRRRAREQNLKARASRTLQVLADHAQLGVYRPATWERTWLAMAVGDDFVGRLVPGDPHGREGYEHILQKPRAQYSDAVAGSCTRHRRLWSHRL